MFDIEKAKAKGMDALTITILQDINDNTVKRESCKLHEFERDTDSKLWKYKCKNCGCIEDNSFVVGYNQGLLHGGIKK